MSVLKTFSADALAHMALPPARYVVPGLLPEGLTLIAGRPKIGKSWLMLNAALGISLGETVLGMRCAKGSVLYLALEDNQRRLQDRLKLTLCGRSAPAELDFATTCPPLDQGGLAAIKGWCATAHNPRLIIIDVFGRVRQRDKPNSRLYEADYESIVPLKKLADDLKLAVLVVHHSRKQAADEDPFDAISGTTGLSAAADALLILDRGRSGVTLYGRGRDVEEFTLALSFDAKSGAWHALGDAEEARRSNERNQIIKVVQEASVPIGPKEIAERSNVSHDSVKHLVLKMVVAGQLTKVSSGKYTSVVHPGHAIHQKATPHYSVNGVNGVNG
jgi:hypothetical protein